MENSLEKPGVGGENITNHYNNLSARGSNKRDKLTGSRNCLKLNRFCRCPEVHRVFSFCICVIKVWLYLRI